MGPRTSLFIIIAVAVVLLVRASVYTVDEREHALKLRFGEIVQTDIEPGLHFKIPFARTLIS